MERTIIFRLPDGPSIDDAEDLNAGLPMMILINGLAAAGLMTTMSLPLPSAAQRLHTFRLMIAAEY